ncbi:unnamed protein product [Mycena citricolor]|uniref:Uncharacterized protein n=1 Tax=Mycena citricolor TaxID=2018698 RepID=A0AAD2GWZ3_9AGAR|nr:unnamed protein product [Mycena citricolor]
MMSCLHTVIVANTNKLQQRTPDHVEPEEIRDYDPKAPLVQETLTEEEEQEKRARIQAHNGRITRWYAYRIRRALKRQRECGLDPRKDPFAVLMGKLSGITRPPKARQGWQQYMREAKAVVDPIIQQKLEALPEGASKRGDFRAGVVRKLFRELEQEEQKAVQQRAAAEGDVKKAEYAASLAAEPPRDPLSRHCAIKALDSFMRPIIKGVHERTGLHVTMLVGGPMPEFGGELGTHLISCGENRAADAVHWGQWDAKRFKRHVTDFFLEYLETAFTKADCEASALAADGLNDGLLVDSTMLATAKYKIASKDDDSSSSCSDNSDDEDLASSDSEIDMEREQLAAAVEGRQGGSLKGRGKRKERTKDKGKEKEGTKDKVAKPRAKRKAKASENAGASTTVPSTTSASPSVPATTLPSTTSASTTVPSTTSASTSSVGVTNGSGVSSRTSSPAPLASSRESSPVAETTAALTSEDRGDDEEDVEAKEANMTPEELKRHRLPEPCKTLVTFLTKHGTATYEDWYADVPDSDLPFMIMRRRNIAKNQAMLRALNLEGAVDGLSRSEGKEAAPAVKKKRRASRSSASAGGPEKRRRSSRLAVTSPNEGSSNAGAGEEDEEMEGSPVPGSAKDGADGSQPDSGASSAKNGTDGSQPPPGASSGKDGMGGLQGSSSVIEQRMRPICPIKADVWFKTAHQNMVQFDLGPHFDAVVEAWTRTEAASRYEVADTKLPSENRPAEVSTWIKGQRRKVPEIRDVNRFGMQFMAWWGGMQPDWRKQDSSNGGWTRGSYGEEWGELFQWGPNGVLSLVAGLCFWGNALTAETSAVDQEKWLEAVIDVGWMLEGLATHYGRWKGRGRW